MCHPPQREAVYLAQRCREFFEVTIGESHRLRELGKTIHAGNFSEIAKVRGRLDFLARLIVDDVTLAHHRHCHPHCRSESVRECRVALDVGAGSNTVKTCLLYTSPSPRD